MLEVPGAWQDAQLALVTDRLRGRCVGLGDGHRDGLVVLAVQQQLRDSEWQAFARRGKRVPLRKVFGRAAQEGSGRLVRRRSVGRESKVGDARLRHDSARSHPWCRAGRITRERRAGSSPESEMPARAVPDHPDAFEIQWYIELAQEIDPRGHVRERLGPAAAVPDAPVLEIPGGDAPMDEVFAELRHHRAVVGRLPEAAVDDDDDPVRPGPA